MGAERLSVLEFSVHKQGEHGADALFASAAVEMRAVRRHQTDAKIFQGPRPVHDLSDLCEAGEAKTIVNDGESL